MNYDLPESVRVGRRDYAVFSDFRAALDIETALADPVLDDRDRAYMVLLLFYRDLDAMPPEDYPEALERVKWFLRGGEDETAPQPRVMDWDQDFPLIVSALYPILGADIRGMAHLHWWTLLSALSDAKDCVFTQVVAIRDKQLRGKELDKFEREFLRRNASIVELKTKYTQADERIFSKYI